MVSVHQGHVRLTHMKLLSPFMEEAEAYACLLALGAVNQRSAWQLSFLVTLVFWLRRHQAPAVQSLDTCYLSSS